MIYNEKYELKNGHYKEKKTVLYMLPQKEMIERVLKNGFILKDIINYDGSDGIGIDFMRIYIFGKKKD